MKKLHHYCKDLNWSLKRLLVYVGGAVMTGAFLKDAWQEGMMSWECYLAYAGGLTILYTPQLALTALRIYKGLPEIIQKVKEG